MQSQVLDIDHWKVEETGGRGSRANEPRVMALQSYGARLASAVPRPYPAVVFLILFGMIILRVRRPLNAPKESNLVPAPPRIAEAPATLFGNRNRILELDEAALRMRHRALDGDDHAEFQRPIRVIALIHRLKLATLQARRFMSNEAHTMRHKIQIGPVGRTVQEPKLS
jgi:hypothetical protein